MARFSRHLGRIPANTATFRGSQAPFRARLRPSPAHRPPLVRPSSAPRQPLPPPVLARTAWWTLPPSPREPTCLRPVSPLEAVHHNGAESTVPQLERWQSGRMHRTRNAAYGQPYRGFKSLPLRQLLRFSLSCDGIRSNAILSGIPLGLTKAISGDCCSYIATLSAPTKRSRNEAATGKP